jgi:hypothetical protein
MVSAADGGGQKNDHNEADACSAHVDTSRLCDGEIFSEHVAKEQLVRKHLSIGTTH